MLAGPQARVEKLLPGYFPQFGEAVGFDPRPRLIAVLGEGGPMPQVQRIGEDLRRDRWVVLLGRAAYLLFEAPGVDRVVRHPQCIAGTHAHDHRAPGPSRTTWFEATSQMRDKGLKGAAGAGRRVLPPQIVDEPVGRNRVPTGDDEQCQH